MKKVALFILSMIMFSCMYAKAENNQKPLKKLYVVKPGKSYLTDIGVTFENNTDYNITVTYFLDSDPSVSGSFDVASQSASGGNFYEVPSAYYDFYLTGPYLNSPAYSWSDSDSHSGSGNLNWGSFMDYVHDGMTITIN